MKIRWLIALGVLVVAASAVVFFRTRKVAPAYVTSVARIGDVTRYVVTTGNVNPVVTVQVGTYVSGPIQAIYCDYNTRVKAGQLCAKIDPRTYRVALDQAKANLESARAQLAKDQASLAYAKVNFARDSKLHARGIVSQDALDSDKSALAQAVAQVQLDNATIAQRRAAVDAAQVNLDYTNIVSPVDGTVVSRNVDVGQTVAASFQTPTLFLIAQDLKKMQVDTNVSESDIGQVQVGQRAVFNVDAYPNHPFEGTVSEMRKAPISVQNVITYDAVISVANPDLLLFPGMTANVRIVTAEHEHVLLVPPQALQFTPHGAFGAPQGNRVYVLEHGQAVPRKVEPGLEGATAVEIRAGALRAGERVITGEARAAHSGGGAPRHSPFAAR